MQKRWNLYFGKLFSRETLNLTQKLKINTC